MRIIGSGSYISETKVSKMVLSIALHDTPKRNSLKIKEFFCVLLLAGTDNKNPRN